MNSAISLLVLYRLARLVLLATAGLALCPLVARAAGWDVSDTGQPYKDVEFTLKEGTWLSVNVSPDGQQIVFDLLGDIYAMPAEGGPATLIHGGPVMMRTPSFSPDGSKLLFLSDQSGGDNAWISNPDGTDLQQVTFVQADVIINPVWEPGGEYIAATRLSSLYRDLNTSELRLFLMGGGSGEVLVSSPGGHQSVHEGQFSPDGRYLYYTQNVGGPATAGDIYVNANYPLYAILRRDLSSGETTELIRGFGGATTPQVSPDGTIIAFVRRVKDKTVLFTFNTLTGEQRPVFDDLARDLQGEWISQGVYYPQFDWFPDNRHVVIWGKGKFFKVDTQLAAAAELPFELVARHRITDVARFAGNLEEQELVVRAIRHLAVAPDQETMVFNALGHLWKKGLPAGKVIRMTAAIPFEFEPAFSANGSHVAYVEWDDEEGSSLKLMTAAGLPVRTLVRSSAIIRQPSFSADSSTLVYHVETGNMCMSGPGTGAGIYTVPVAGGVATYVTGPAMTPKFSPDGQRIYYVVEDYSTGTAGTRLESVDLAGFGKREHAILHGSDRTDLQLSPDLRWVAFKDQQQYFVTRLLDLAGPMDLANTAESATPVVPLTDLGGYSLTWTSDSSRIYWLLGDELFNAAAGASPTDPSISVGLTVARDVPDSVLAFTGARLITISGETIENGTLLIQRNRIAALGPAGDILVPDHAEVIDVTGKTIMPGLVNMHGHLEDCYYGSTGAIPQKQASLYASLAFGTTTNFDPYATELPSLSVSEMRDSGETVGPRTFSVGSVLFGRPGKFDPVYTPINSLEDAEKIMQRKSALGARLVKSYRQPLRQQRQQIIKAARQAGVMVAIEGEGHFYNNISAVLDGHNSIEHNLPVATYYDDVIQLFAHGRTANTPTLIVTFGELLGENYIYQNLPTWEDPRIDSFVPQVNSGYSPLGTPYGAPLYARAMTTFQAADELWDIGFRSVARSTRKLDDAGVLINVGSHGQVQGLAMHWEMQLMAEGGMGNARVLRAATLNGATTLGLDGQIGTLEVGKLADIIVLDKNPLEDIRHTNTVRYTVINGRVYDPYSMDEIISRKKARSRFYWETEPKAQP